MAPPAGLTLGEQVGVLRTFNDLARQWFPVDNFQSALTSGVCLQNADFMDMSEAALFVTNATFGRTNFGQNLFDSVLKSGYGLEASRIPAVGDVMGPVNTSPVYVKPLAAFRNWTSSNCNQNVNMLACFGSQFLSSVADFVQVGELRGIQTINESHAKWNLAAQTWGGSTDSPIGSGNPPSQGPFSVTFNRPFVYGKPYGGSGGLLATQNFALMNLGRAYWENYNAREKLPRRWSTAVMSQLLCRPPPALRLSDVAGLVDSYSRARGDAQHPIPPFWLSTGCQSCHASTDSMSGVLRNVVSTRMTNAECANPDLVADAGFIVLGQDTLASSQPYPPWTNIDDQFNKRPPQGKLLFRSIRGGLVDENVENVVDLANTLADTDDFYICAASRYLKFLTGLEANLVSEDEAYLLSPDQRILRQQVIDLGLSFKSHRRVQQLIFDIVSDEDLYWKEGP